ncbi:MAG: hypothetical protein K8T25_01430, partial [Planctomycetia bacterium]|nr:hypothetical protein [Planctomycetia bacterium]
MGGSVKISLSRVICIQEEVSLEWWKFAPLLPFARFDRNVISGNAGDGIALDLSSDNWVLSNYIGVDAGGTLDRGNGGNGVF